ncbi:hypothetical protein D9M68_965610 [compost metagenome]
MASLFEGARPADFSSGAMPSGAPESDTSGISSGIPPLLRLMKSCSAASAAAALWKRVVISFASATFASFGFAPAAIACFSDSMCASDWNDSSVYQRHISVSEMLSTLANIELASSVMPM